MNILIRGDKLKVTDAIRAHIEEKLGRLNKYFDSSDEIHANVLVKVRDKDQIIEVTIPTKKFTLRAEEKHSDLFICFFDAIFLMKKWNGVHKWVFYSDSGKNHCRQKVILHGSDIKKENIYYGG